jgi:glycosyltransferase involved in cell wall biosynthesis
VKISAVIPCYNRAALIERALESARAQTVPTDEIVVVDDGSKDGSPAVVERYAEAHPAANIRLVRLPKNGGVSAARNAGIAAATGPWIAFLDSDDLWLPDHNRVLLETAARHPSAQFVFGDCRYVQEEGAVVEVAPVAPTSFQRPGILQALTGGTEAETGLTGREFYRLMLRFSVIPTSGSMARKQALETIGGFRVGQRFGEDRLCWVRLLAYFPAAYALAAVSEYVYHTTNSTRPEKRLENTRGLFELTREFLRKPQEYRLGEEETAMLGTLRREQLAEIRYFASRRGLRTMQHYRDVLAEESVAFATRDWMRGAAASVYALLKPGAGVSSAGNS